MQNFKTMLQPSEASDLGTLDRRSGLTSPRLLHGAGDLRSTNMVNDKCWSLPEREAASWLLGIATSTQTLGYRLPRRFVTLACLQGRMQCVLCALCITTVHADGADFE